MCIQLHIGGVVPQSKLLIYAPASSIADVNKQNKKGNVCNSPNASPNKELIQKVANHCGCPIEIASKALEASNWDGNTAVTKIEALKAQRNGTQ